MRLDTSNFVYLGNKDFRILTSIEVGMRNHEYVPLPLIISIANIPSHGIRRAIVNLHKLKLITHSKKPYDGYKLTYLGLDYLALRALSKAGAVESVGRKIGVGKEADVHIAKGSNGELVVIKLHRLGRKSFRTIKNNRDYLGKRSHASWMYLAQIAAKKEYSYLKAMHERDFPVPSPLDINRHVIVMQYIEGIPLAQVRLLKNPRETLEILFRLIIDMAEIGIIHSDFNEFNIIVDETNDKIYLIDFPQVIPIYHTNASAHFNRDVNCIVELFNRKFKVIACDYPKFENIINDELIDNIKSIQSHLNINKNDEVALQNFFHPNNPNENDSSSPNNYNENSPESEYQDSNSDTDSAPEENDTFQIIVNDEISSSSEDVTDDFSDKSSEDKNDLYEIKKNHPVQIWHPSISRYNEKNVQEKIRHKNRNKSKSEQRKNYKQNKIKGDIKHRL